MPAVGVLAGFGLAYAITALVFRAPVPVQPMKVAAAVMIAAAPSAEAVVAAGLVLGAFFLIAGATGVIERLAGWVPEAVTAGLQLGLGGALVWLALARIVQAPVFGTALLALLAVLLLLRPAWPAAVIMLVVGIGADSLLGFVPAARCLPRSRRGPRSTGPDSRRCSTAR